MKQIKQLLLVLFTATMLSACVTPPKPLYYHGEQAEAVYSYLKADLSIGDQILLMEQTMQKAKANNLALAPGFHAHLGMLYFESGNTSGGVEQFELEKSLFPESSKYLDYLLAQLRGRDAQ